MKVERDSTHVWMVMWRQPTTEGGEESEGALEKVESEGRDALRAPLSGCDGPYCVRRYL